MRLQCCISPSSSADGGRVRRPAARLTSRVRRARTIAVDDCCHPPPLTSGLYRQDGELLGDNQVQRWLTLWRHGQWG